MRKVVAEGLASSLPPPYTGIRTLTKKVNNEREHAEWTAKFLAAIDQAAERSTTMSELVRLDSLSLPELIRQSPAVLGTLDRRINEITGKPAWMAATDPVPFGEIITRWTKNTNAPKKGIQDRTTKCDRFVAWLGHDNMARVTFQNCRDYRDFLIDEGELEPTSVLNHVKALKALSTYAFDNELITSDPMSRVKYKAGDGEEREDFTPEERALILTAARDAGPVIYWCNWLSSFSAARLSEIVDAHTRDVGVEEGIPVIKIHRKYRSPDQRLKTKVSTRTVPLHSALLDEGFLDYVETIKTAYGDGSLFPQLTLDGYGRRNGIASKRISNWLRNVVGITDPKKVFHSHRHTAVSHLRNTLTPEGHPVVKEGVELYLTGHAGKGAHAGYGKQWIKTLKAAIEVIPNPLINPNHNRSGVDAVLEEDGQV